MTNGSGRSRIVAGTGDDADTLLTHAKMAVRANYSNPPAHGGEIVATVLADQELRAAWELEVAEMRGRINANRQAFVEALTTTSAQRDWTRLLEQRGMFSLLGLTTEQVRALRDDHAVYVVGAGRVNVAGITRANLGPACAAIAAVLQS